MVKKFQIILIFILLTSLFLAPALTLAQQQAKDIKSILDEAATEAGYEASEEAGQTGIAAIAGSIIRILLSLLGVIFISLVIYGGYIWMIARGNEEEIKKAKDIIRDGIIGLIIILGAWAIYFTLTYIWFTD